MNLAEYIARFLVEKGVRHVFGFQGGAILKLLDEMIATGRIEFLQNYHEQASAFCADAYSRITGNIGVALATSGPGATNLMTGIANAQFDSIPTLFITGQDYSANVLKDNGARQNGFQDLDIVSIARPITKYAMQITEPSRIRHELEKAWWLAKSGRPGAVLLDIPIDIQFKDVDPESMAAFESVAPPSAELPTADIARMLAKARRPVILIGGGVRVAGAVEEVRQLADITGIPVIGTVNGLDVTERCQGFSGLHGHTWANLAIQNADLLLALGVRFGQRQVGKQPEAYTRARIIHVDIDARELARIFPDEVCIQADLKPFLASLLVSLQHVPLPDFGNWSRQVHAWSARYRHNVHLNDEAVDPVKAVEKLMAFTLPDAIMTSDVGQNQMWVAQGFRLKSGQRLLNSCGLGSMGYSLPAAIGAQIARPKQQVIAFTGDGGLQMNIQELQFISQRRLPIKCVVFNNNTLGMMREVQKRYYHEHYLGANPDEFSCPNLAGLAAAYGLKYARINTLDEIDGVGAALNDDLPWLIDISVSLDSRLSNRYDEASCFVQERIDD